jgi:hypothetical protein
MLSRLRHARTAKLIITTRSRGFMPLCGAVKAPLRGQKNIMNHTNEKILQRIQDLIQKGESIKTQRWVQRPPSSFPNFKSHSSTPRGEYRPYVESAAFEEWRTNALSLIESLCESGSVYRTNFEAKVETSHTSDVDKGIGILRALKNDIDRGYLTRYRTLVAAEVFDDFLEIAEYLLEGGYKDPAASLIGAVLEDGLRQMCRKNNIEVKKSDDISCLNKKLADKQIYNRITQKKIQAWKAIRDSADHGKFDEYKEQDIQDMLEGVKRFLGENLK